MRTAIPSFFMTNRNNVAYLKYIADLQELARCALPRYGFSPATSVELLSHSRDAVLVLPDRLTVDQPLQTSGIPRWSESDNLRRLIAVFVNVSPLKAIESVSV